MSFAVPSPTRTTTESKFSTGTDIRYDESTMVRRVLRNDCFSRETRQETVQIVKKTTAVAKGLERRSIFSTEGSFGHWGHLLGVLDCESFRTHSWEWGSAWIFDYAARVWARIPTKTRWARISIRKPKWISFGGFQRGGFCEGGKSQ